MKRLTLGILVIAAIGLACTFTGGGAGPVTPTETQGNAAQTNSNSSSQSTGLQQSFASNLPTPFSEVPIPAGAHITVTGSTGFTYTTTANIHDIWIFYQNGMPKLGWVQLPDRMFYLANQSYRADFSREGVEVSVDAENREGNVTVTISSP